MKSSHLKIAISLLAVLVVIIVVKLYIPTAKVGSTAYVIYLSDSKLTKFEGAIIERLMEFHSGEDVTEILTESNRQIITLTTILIDRFKMSLESCNSTKCIIEKQFYALSQPHEVSKKILRREIEENFSGEERVAVLRSIIVVRGLGEIDTNEPCGGQRHLVDDLIYIEDNFGGIAIPNSAKELCG